MTNIITRAAAMVVKAFNRKGRAITRNHIKITLVQCVPLGLGGEQITKIWGSARNSVTLKMEHFEYDPIKDAFIFKSNLLDGIKS